jgi:hypothetical protein
MYNYTIVYKSKAQIQNKEKHHLGPFWLGKKGTRTKILLGSVTQGN